MSTFCCPFHGAEDAMYMDVHKTLYPGPSPVFSSRVGSKTRRGATCLEYCIGCMEQPGGQTWNGGAQVSNGGSGTTVGDGPGFTLSMPLVCVDWIQRRNEVRWRPGEKASLAPRVRTWGLSEENLLYLRKYLWHCWEFSAPPAVIRLPLSDSSPP